MTGLFLKALYSSSYSTQIAKMIKNSCNVDGNSATTIVAKKTRNIMRQYQKIVYVGPLGVSENLILEKVENIPATIKIHIILLKYHLTLAYRDAKYLFPIFEIDKRHWCSASNG